MFLYASLKSLIQDGTSTGQVWGRVMFPLRLTDVTPSPPRRPWAVYLWTQSASHDARCQQQRDQRYPKRTDSISNQLNCVDMTSTGPRGWPGWPWDRKEGNTWERVNDNKNLILGRKYRFNTLYITTAYIILVKLKNYKLKRNNCCQQNLEPCTTCEY